MTELATVLVAGLIGLIGTMIGAVATGWAAKINADKNIEAVRGQAHDQAVNEHAHWLRQQRLAAYEGFLDAWDECTRIRQELARPVRSEDHAMMRAELSRTASQMMERARRISLLGPVEVAFAAEAISRATMENIAKEDAFGEYAESAVSRMREQEQEFQGISQEVIPGLRSEELREAMRHVGDLDRLRELYTVEQLQGIVEAAQNSMGESEELLRRMAAFADSGTEFNEEVARFLEDFQRNIEIAEESRGVFVEKVRNAIANPGT